MQVDLRLDCPSDPDVWCGFFGRWFVGLHWCLRAAELHRAHSLYALAPPKPLIGARPAFPLISQECLCECVQQTAPAQACSGPLAQPEARQHLVQYSD